VADAFQAVWPHCDDECDAIRRGLYNRANKPAGYGLVTRAYCGLRAQGV